MFFGGTILPIAQSIEATIVDWDGYIYIYIHTNALRDHAPRLPASPNGSAIKRFVIEELVTKKSVPLYNVYVCTYAPRYVLFWDTNGETQCGIKEYPSTYVLPSYR